MKGEWLVCRCGEAVRDWDIDDHHCRPVEQRPPDLYRRWLDHRVKREIIRYLDEHGKDPAFDQPAQSELRIS